MRVFLDTNVLVSAFTARGICADLLRLVLLEHTLVCSEVVLKELQRVLGQKLKIPPATIGKIIGFLREESEIVNPASPGRWPISDPVDQWIVSSALEAKADILVTGDHDLLDVAADLPVRTTDPRGFWSLLKA